MVQDYKSVITVVELAYSTYTAMLESLDIPALEKRLSDYQIS